jgi:hypothetical protein
VNLAITLGHEYDHYSWKHRLYGNKHSSLLAQSYLQRK